MTRPLRVLDLFSGIGGFSLGLERTGGFEAVAFCEIDPFARRVLAKHWPEVPRYEDVRTLTAERLAADGIAVDVICGGFPCQDISLAGGGAGIEGERSGLWREYARLIRTLRPRFVIVENVAALLGRGLAEVLGALATFGYDAEWHCLPASYLGAPHQRDRLWIVANAGSEQHESGGNALWGQSAARLLEASLADAQSAGLEGWGERGNLRAAVARPREGSWPIQGNWSAEPDVGRVAHGVPARVDRLRGLGNAVVPQIPELIGRAILASMAEQRAAA